MAGGGEVCKREDGSWGFQVNSAAGEPVATEGGLVFAGKDEARGTLQRLLRGDFNGPIVEVATIACGIEITEDTTLESDLVCASGPALIIAADNVRLDLHGFTVSCSPGATSPGPGIVLRGVSGATLQKGTITGFGAAVSVEGGSGNTVRNITAVDNHGTAEGDFGDGIVVNGSSDNRIEGNTVVRNGPFSGISLVGQSQRNEVINNIVADNNMLHVGNPSAGRQCMGIRMEGPAANNNKIVGNQVTNSGADGIVVLPTCLPNTNPECAGSPPNEGNEITSNISNANGTSGRGDGIRLFTVANPVAAAHTTISENITDNNKTNGISIDAVGSNNPGPTENKVIGNSAHGNGAYDGFDANVRCGTNTWQDNDFGEPNQKCVAASPSPVPPPSGPTPPPDPGPAPPMPPMR